MPLIMILIATMFFPAVDAFANGMSFTENGSNFTVPNANVGIGTIAPQGKLEVDGTTYLLSGNVSIGTTAPAGLLDVNRKLTVLSTGNVGIGVAAPTIKLEVAGQYASQKFTGTNAVDWNNGNVQYVQLASGSNTAFTFANPKDGGRYMLILRQPSGGSVGTVAWWPVTVLWAGGVVPTLTATLSKTDIISCVYDGTNTQYYCTPTVNF